MKDHSKKRKKRKSLIDEKVRELMEQGADLNAAIANAIKEVNGKETKKKSKNK